MKITLINPNYRTKLGGDDSISSILPPLGIAYIAAVLQKYKFDVNIIDMNAENISNEGLLGMLMVQKPDVVGITCTTPTINAVNTLAKDIKWFNPNISIVVGGPHPTSLPTEVMVNPNIDYAVIGEGEKTMLELCMVMRNGANWVDLDMIDGLVWRYKGTIRTNNPRGLIKDINVLPFPAIDLLPLSKYKSSYSKYERFANILTSRGCPGACIYCNKRIFGNNVRMRSAQSIFDEIKMLHDKYGYKEFHIVDDLFTQDRDRVIDFCNLVINSKLDIVWKLGNGIRVGTVTFELLRRMKEAGLYSVSFGIESGNQGILNKMKKGQTIQMCKDAVCFARELNLFVVGFFMLGNIGETEATMRDTINLAKSLPLDVAQFSILVPFPGTEVRAIIEREGKILENDYGKYDNIDGKMVFEHGELTKELVERMHKQAYKEFYSRPSFMFKRLMRTRSWLELKNQIKGGMAIFGIGGKK
jgi:radical SAM superfamily enzyme YgiQ (UPF0313 family)